MHRSLCCLSAIVILSGLTLACSRTSTKSDSGFAPSEVVDLGAMVTEDLPQRFWGKAFMKQMGFTRQNSLEVISWKFPADGATVSGNLQLITSNEFCRVKPICFI